MTPRKEGEIRLFALPAFLLGLILLFGGLLYWQMEAFQQAIRQEVRQVLEDPAYRENAAAISAGFRRCSGAKGAADKILQVCGG